VHQHERQRPVILIWDGLPSRRSRRMLHWIADQRDWLSLSPLPVYAPELLAEVIQYYEAHQAEIDDELRRGGRGSALNDERTGSRTQPLPACSYCHGMPRPPPRMPVCYCTRHCCSSGI
jgi:hypothetical protein